MSATLTNDEVRAIVFSHNAEVRQQFAQYFQPKIDDFIVNLTRAYGRLQEMPSRVPYDKRSAWVDHFLFVAFNSLLTAFHLFISGFLIPAGNLMRHYGEAVAMALLLSHRKINTFDVLEREPSQFPIHKALDLVKQKRNAKLLGIHSEHWEEFSKSISFYNLYSHPSVYAGASLDIFSSPGAQHIGGGFDPAKLEDYTNEIRQSISACMRLHDAIVVAESHLINS
jgi:hypothetical protein